MPREEDGKEEARQGNVINRCISSCWFVCLVSWVLRVELSLVGHTTDVGSWEQVGSQSSRSRSFQSSRFFVTVSHCTTHSNRGDFYYFAEREASCRRRLEIGIEMAHQSEFIPIEPRWEKRNKKNKTNKMMAIICTPTFKYSSPSILDCSPLC